MGLSYKTVTFSTKTIAFTSKGGNICPIPQSILSIGYHTQLPLMLSSENKYLGIFRSLQTACFLNDVLLIWPFWSRHHLNNLGCRREILYEELC